MISEVVDNFVPNLMKHKIISGYASHSRDGIRFMDLGQSIIRCRVLGKGPRVVVFVTDPPMVIEHYDYLADLIKNDYQLIIFEAPGFGFSIPSIQFDYRFKSLIDVVEAFLERLSLGPVTFVGPCALGYVGIGLAKKRPDLINNLMLTQVPNWTEILKWKSLRDPKGLLSVPVLSQLLLKMLKTKRTPVWLEIAIGNTSLVESFNQIAQTAFQHGAQFNLASGFQNLLLKTSPLPADVAVNTMFLWGEQDGSHCNTSKDSSLQMIPHATLIKIKEAGHFPELEVPETFVAHLETLIQAPEQSMNK